MIIIGILLIMLGGLLINAIYFNNEIITFMNNQYTKDEVTFCCNVFLIISIILILGGIGCIL